MARLITVKKLLIFTLALVVYPLLAVSAYAANVADPCTGASTPIGTAICALADNSIGSTVQKIVVAIIVLAVIIALLYLLYGGVKWIISRGDKTEVEAARNHITAAVVGLIVVFLAIFIVMIILALFGISLDNLSLPSIT